MSLIDDLFELQVPKNPAISPNCQQIVYTTSLVHRVKKGEHKVSTLWLAQTGHAKSAQQLTSGKYNDTSPEWSPDGKSVAFISDRGKQGESSAIYTIKFSPGGEAYPVTPAENKEHIKSFRFSPDGKFIAYLVADEKSEQKKKKIEEKDDPNVWGEDLSYSRLRMVHLSTKKVTTLVSLDRHIQDFDWNEDGTKIAFAHTKDPRITSAHLHGNDLSIVDINTKAVTNVGHVPGMLSYLFWAADSLYFLGAADMKQCCTSSVIYSVDLKAKSFQYRKRAHGDTDCASAIVKAGQDIVVGAINGVEDSIHMLDGRTVFSAKAELGGWDAAFTTDSDELILSFARGGANQPAEIYSTTGSGGALVQLSNHGESLKESHDFGSVQFVSCQSTDDKFRLDGVFYSPGNNEDSEAKGPYPTFVLVHGGPYYRISDTFEGEVFLWNPALRASGYAVLCPNYRGSSGRGDDFAAAARGGIGTVDYDDVIALTQHAIELGLADKDRLMLGGWSQGGFMSYVSAVRNGLHGHGWKWKALVPGAGVSEPDTLIFTSDVGSTYELELAGKAPWRMDMGYMGNRHASAIWNFKHAAEKGNVPPMLILHGEQDERVPLEQAVAVRRALEDYGLPFEFVSYPREPHDLREYKHMVDSVQRVLRWADTYIGKKKSLAVR